MPYQLPFPQEAATEIVVAVSAAGGRTGLGAADGKRLVPPALPARRQGYWVNLLRVRKSGVLRRHRHPAPVHGFVLKGRWHYLEHDWAASEGGYVFEPPGETHTLVCPTTCRR